MNYRLFSIRKSSS